MVKIDTLTRLWRLIYTRVRHSFSGYKTVSERKHLFGHLALSMVLNKVASAVDAAFTASLKLDHMRDFHCCREEEHDNKSEVADNTCRLTQVRCGKLLTSGEK